MLNVPQKKWNKQVMSNQQTWFHNPCVYIPYRLEMCMKCCIGILDIVCTASALIIGIFVTIFINHSYLHFHFSFTALISCLCEISTKISGRIRQFLDLFITVSTIYLLDASFFFIKCFLLTCYLPSVLQSFYGFL